MKHSRTVLQLCALLLFCSLTALAQTSGNTKRFDKGGLAFNYPGNWNLADDSKTNTQQLTLSREGSTAQIKIAVPKTLMDTPEKMAQARTDVIEPYIEAVFKLLVDMGGKPEKTAASVTIGGAKAEGVRMRAVLGNEPGEATIYWRIAGNRLVVLIFFGSDQSIKQATPAFDAVRNSLTVKDILDGAQAAQFSN